MPSYHLDYETYSEADIGDVGAYRYANDPSTEILLCAISKDGEPPVIWDRFASEKANTAALSLIREAAQSGNPVYAHNAQFEAAVSKYLFESTFWDPAPQLEQWRCTQAMCRIMAIPSSLDKASKFLGLVEKKDTRGMALIRTFSVPTTVTVTAQRKEVQSLLGLKPKDVKNLEFAKEVRRIDPRKDAEMLVTIAGESITVREAWQMFREYCLQDVMTEIAIHDQLGCAEMTGDVLDAFLFDARLNDRGFPVDVATLEKARTLRDDYAATMEAEFRSLTGVSTSQRDAFLRWVSDRGYRGDNLQAPTVDAALAEPQGPLWGPMTVPEARRAMQIRSQVGSAAVKKIDAMLAHSCDDNRCRGQFKFWGAMRTGRSSGSGVQPQNIVRPTVKSHEGAFLDIANGYDAQTIELLHDDVMEVVVSVMRHFIRDPERDFLDADFAQIEARVLAWITGHDELLDAFRAGEDLYRRTAAGMFDVTYDEVSKDQRFLGKIASLACGYNGGIDAFATMAKNHGVVVPEERAASIVKAYRESNPQITSFWKEVGAAMLSAIRNPGSVVRLSTCDVSYQVRQLAGYLNLVTTLPSGRKLYHPEPAITRGVAFRRGTSKVQMWSEGTSFGSMYSMLFDDAHANPRAFLEENYQGVLKMFPKDTGQLQAWVADRVTYYGEFQGQWGRRVTHGGVGTENLAQAIAGDFLTAGCVRAEKAGYEVVMVIHDQALATFYPERGQSAEEFTSLLCELPPWAPDFPLKAETSIVPFYTKDS